MMIKPGMLLNHDNFQFSDGSIGWKILVVLSMERDGRFIVVKTTSQPRNKSRSSGCNLRDRFPNFFLPRQSCSLKLDTWIQLDEFHEIDAGSLMKGLKDKSINTIGYPLPAVITREVVDCAVQSRDISRFQREILKETLQAGW